MPVLIPIALYIGSAVISAVVAVSAVVAAIAVAVASAAVAVAGAIAAAVSAIVGGVVTAVSWAASGIVSGITAVYSAVAPTFITIGKGIWTFAKAIYSGMQAFLKAIHFKAILKIHNLAMIFSKDYREMMAKIYDEISKVSEALGLGSHFITLVLNDARNVVMDVSSMFGRSYDLSEVGWLSTMNEYLQDFSTRAEEYKHHPAVLINDIAEYIEKPSIDAKAGFQQALLTIVDGVVEVAEVTAGKVITLRENLEQTILHLPKSISKEIFDEINPIFEGFDKFIEDEYKPVAKDITNAISVLSGTSIRTTDKLGELTDSILNPGDLLGNVDRLSELERIRQEDKIAQIANRAPVRAQQSVNLKIEEAHKGLRKIFEAITTKRVRPPYHVVEAVGLQYKPGVAPILRKTWFVGDF